MKRFDLKRDFNKHLKRLSPDLFEKCLYDDSHSNVDPIKLSHITLYDKKISSHMIGDMSDFVYYEFLNDLYNYIRNNRDMIEFWLL